MSRVFFAVVKSLGDAWFQALDAIMTKGRDYEITKGSYEGTRRLALPVSIDIEYPGSRPLYPIMPEGIPAPTDDVDIQEYTLYLMTGTKKPNEHYTYGEDLEWQIPYVIKMFKKEGFGTNHCYMTVGRPETLYFYDTEVEYSESIVVRDRKTGGLLRARQIHNRWNLEKDVKPSSQCLRGIDVWVEDGTLNFWVYFRSWDLWGGFPVNLGGIQLVKEYMAAEIGVKDGGMIVSCKDLHVYEHGWFVALARLRKDASQIPGGAK